MAGFTISPTMLAARARSFAAVPWVWLGLALAAGYLPHLIAYGANLTRLEHYQFFPLAWLGAIFLLWSRRDEIVLNPGSEGSAVGWVGVGLGTLLLTVAGVLGSSWLAMISVLPMVLGWIWLAGGWTAVRAVGPALALFATTIRLPGSLDSAMIFRLRAVAVAIAGRILDAVGIIHVPLGNVLRVAGGELFVDEACSGINSLVSIVAVVLFVGLFLRRHLAHLAVLVVGSVGIVLLANVARISTVAIALDRYHVDLLRGWQHEALGITIYAISLALAASLDQLLLLLGLIRPWQSSLMILTPKPKVVVSPRSGAGARPRHLTACASALATVAMILPVRWARDARTGGATEIRVDLVVDRAQKVLTEASLPGQLAGWQRVGFRTEERRPENPTGQYSAIWDYRLGSRTALVSIDYPFLGWHELLTCYEGLGWTTGRQVLVRGPIDPGPEAAPYLATTLNNRRGEHATLRFALVDDRGQWLAPASREGLVLAGREVAWQAAPSRPTYQVQVLSVGFRPQGDEEARRCTLLFEAACRELKSRLDAQRGSTP